MLLTIDIGNSSTKFAVFDDAHIVNRARIDTVWTATPEEILDLLELEQVGPIDAMVVSTVVRELRETYEIIGNEHLKVPTIFVDHTFNLGFSINYVKPSDCGPDRLVAAYAAVQLMGKPVIVCDFGTATTIDFISPDNRFQGGIIAPGIETMSNCLVDNTSRLPQVGISQPDDVIGNSTVNSIRSGIYYGYVGLVDGIIERMKKDAGYDVSVIATGGYAQIISRESKYVTIFRNDLIHLGLFGIWHSLSR